MNAQNAKDFLPLVQALADGKTIQCNLGAAGGREEWSDFSGECSFTGIARHYRIKPEPREFWIVNGRAYNQYHASSVNACGDEAIHVREVIP